MGLLTMTFYLANAVIALIGGAVSLLGAVWSLVLGGLILFIGAMALYHFDRTVPNITTKVTT
jgi:predicted MFS family arabinose efflux permease